MDLGLAGKVAFVTGGSRNIGLEIARRLAMEGALVVVGGRSLARLASAQADLRRDGLEVTALEVDVRSPERVQAALEELNARFGGLDVLVNIPGGIWKEGPFSAIEPEEWRSAIDLNLLTPIAVTRAAIPYMRPRPWGRVVNIGAYYLAPSTPGLYTRAAENVVAKTAVAAATKVMSEELAPDITVNCVAPGPVGTDHPWARDTGSFPVPRPADRRELAALVAFLCSASAGYLTGLTIPFDGGATRRIF